MAELVAARTALVRYKLTREAYRAATSAPTGPCARVRLEAYGDRGVLNDHRAGDATLTRGGGSSAGAGTVALARAAMDDARGDAERAAAAIARLTQASRAHHGAGERDF